MVLSAWGCGAFRNPPQHIAKLFLECLASEPLRGAFQTVTFAILEDHNSPVGGNLPPFRAALDEVMHGQSRHVVTGECQLEAVQAASILESQLHITRSLAGGAVAPPKPN